MLWPLLVIFSQGDAAGSLMSLQNDSVKLLVFSQAGFVRPPPSSLRGTMPPSRPRSARVIFGRPLQSARAHCGGLVHLVELERQNSPNRDRRTLAVALEVACVLEIPHFEPAGGAGGWPGGSVTSSTS